MPKIYYRCSKCHDKLNSDFCNKCDDWVSEYYKCQYNYWWELLYIKIRDILNCL